MPSRVAFFLSGHGFGHGVRNSAIMEALPAGVDLHIFTSLPEAFFREELHRPFTYHPCELDCGCLQTSTVDVDVEATLARYAELESRRFQLIDRYAPLLASLAPDLAIGDIPPLAFPIAKAAGVPSYALYNFTWLDIYRPYLHPSLPYLHRHPAYADMLRRMEEDYSLADEKLRLFPYLEGGMPGRIEDMGMLGRPGQDRREDFARRFGLDIGKRWALVYIGSHGLEGVAWRNLAAFEDWEFMGLYPLEGAPANYRQIRKDPSFRYADLAASCDLVIGKLGYNLVVECLSHAKPLIFLGRRDFEEFNLLRDVVQGRGLGRQVALPDLMKLDIGDSLRALTAEPRQPVPADALPRILRKIGVSTG